MAFVLPTGRSAYTQNALYLQKNHTLVLICRIHEIERQTVYLPLTVAVHLLLSMHA